ncbi:MULTISPECIES: hypothetical protein [unclassified Marinovum]|uniref:hypothetical protein n=1 Tax=unclassified Marinovum TaxID=2647166 RepID=UPI003EDB8AD6
MSSYVDLPNALKLRHLNFHLQATTASSGRGLNAREQIMYAENRYWTATLTLPQRSQADAMLSNALGDELCGRAGVLRVAFANLGTIGGGNVTELTDFYAALGVSDDDVASGFISFSDGTGFDDGTGFALPEIEDPVVAADVAVGLRQVQLEGYLGWLLSRGAFFSVNDFLYRVWTNDDGLITFNPPLREAVTEGQEVRVIFPRTRLRLSDDAGWKTLTDYMRWGRETNVVMEEVFER